MLGSCQTKNSCIYPLAWSLDWSGQITVLFWAEKFGEIFKIPSNFPFDWLNGRAKLTGCSPRMHWVSMFYVSQVYLFPENKGDYTFCSNKESICLRLIWAKCLEVAQWCIGVLSVRHPLYQYADTARVSSCRAAGLHFYCMIFSKFARNVNGKVLLGKLKFQTQSIQSSSPAWLQK